MEADQQSALKASDTLRHHRHEASKLQGSNFRLRKGNRIGNADCVDAESLLTAQRMLFPSPERVVATDPLTSGDWTIMNQCVHVWR